MNSFLHFVVNNTYCQVSYVVGVLICLGIGYYDQKDKCFELDDLMGIWAPIFILSLGWPFILASVLILGIINNTILASSQALF